MISTLICCPTLLAHFNPHKRNQLFNIKQRYTSINWQKALPILQGENTQAFSFGLMKVIVSVRKDMKYRK
jgi:hypothetical protein